MLENLALSNTNPMLNVYVICPGFIYGCGEDFFFDYFRKAWIGGIDFIPGQFFTDYTYIRFSANNSSNYRKKNQLLIIYSHVIKQKIQR